MVMRMFIVDAMPVCEAMFFFFKNRIMSKQSLFNGPQMF